MSASSMAHTPYTSKQPYNGDRNTNRAPSPHHAKRFKQVQVEDMLCEGSVEYQPPLQPSLEKVPLTSGVQEQGLRQGDRTSCHTADEMSRVSHSQALDAAGCPSDPTNRNEIQSGSTDQPTSDDVPSTPFKTQQTLPPASDSFKSIAVEVGGHRVD
jgi:hypothetical protein